MCAVTRPAIYFLELSTSSVLGGRAILDKAAYICTDVKYRLNGERLVTTRRWQPDEITAFLQDQETVDVDSTIYDRILATHGRYQLKEADDNGVKPMDGDEAADFVRTVFNEEDVTKNVLDVVTDGDEYAFNLRLRYDIVPDDGHASRKRGDTVISGEIPVTDGEVERYLREYEGELRDTVTVDVAVDHAADLLRQTDGVTGTLEHNDRGIPLRVFDPDTPSDKFAGPSFDGFEAANDLSYLDNEYTVQPPEITVVPDGGRYTFTVTCDVSGFTRGARRGHRANHTLVYEGELSADDMPDTVQQDIGIT